LLGTNSGHHRRHVGQRWAGSGAHGECSAGFNRSVARWFSVSSSIGETFRLVALNEWQCDF